MTREQSQQYFCSTTELPDVVSISPLNHTGPMVEGTEYQLQCDVLNVAPVQNLTVTWYRGNETIKTDYSDQSNLTTPVNESYILTITPSREDDGALYRCEVQLNLGPEGPHPSPVKTSEHHHMSVHCEYFIILMFQFMLTMASSMLTLSSYE